MLNDALKELAAGPTAARTKIKFVNVGKANAYIYELEELCGIERRPPIFNVLRANARINHLEDVLSKGGIALPGANANVPPISAAAALATPPPPPPPPAPAAPAISTRKLEIVAGEFFAGDVMRLAELPENEKRNSIAVLFWKNRVSYPGCESDFASIDTTKNQRNISDAHFAGMNKIRVSIQQELIAAKLKKIK